MEIWEIALTFLIFIAFVFELRSFYYQTKELRKRDLELKALQHAQDYTRKPE